MLAAGIEWGEVTSHPVVAVLITATVLGGVRLGQRVLSEIRQLAEGQRRMDADLRRHMHREEADRKVLSETAERQRAETRADISALWSAVDGVRGEVSQVVSRVERIDDRTERIESATARTAEWAEHHVREAALRDERIGRHDERISRLERE